MGIVLMAYEEILAYEAVNVAYDFIYKAVFLSPQIFGEKLTN